MKLFRWFKKPRALPVQVFQPEKSVVSLLEDLESAPRIITGKSLVTKVTHVPIIYKGETIAPDTSYATIAEDKRMYRAAVKNVLTKKLRSY